MSNNNSNIRLGLKSGSRSFETAQAFLSALDTAAQAAIQSAKQRVINLLRSAGPNRGYLFPKDTKALIEDGVQVTTDESIGGLRFTFTYGFDISYAKFVNEMDFVTKLGLYHFKFFENKLIIVTKLLEEELQAAISAAGFDVQVDLSE